MARKGESRSDGRSSSSVKRLGRAARNNMTTPNLLAAGAVALGAAAFAYLRDEDRRNTLKDSARRMRDSLPRMGEAEPIQPQLKTSKMPQPVPVS